MTSLQSRKQYGHMLSSQQGLATVQPVLYSVGTTCLMSSFVTYSTMFMPPCYRAVEYGSIRCVNAHYREVAVG